MRNWRRKNPEKARAINARWAKKNKKRVKTYFKNYSPKYYLRNKERYKFSARKSHLKKAYGLTLDQYDGLVRIQKGCCAICQNPQRGGRQKRLAVDHNHGTTKVRGLLCDWCNRGLGMFEEDILRFESAIRYLRER